ncbi:MAG: phage minor head protein [Dehalococcoidia bacterium]
MTAPDPIAAIAEALEAPLAARLLAAWAAVIGTASEGALLAALGAPTLLDQIARIEALLGGPLDSALSGALIEPLSRAAVGGVAAAVLPPGGAATVAGRFAVLNPRAAGWAAGYSARLVRQIGDDQRSWLRSVLAGGYTGEHHPRVTAKVIRQQIGLTSAMAGWVENYRASLAGLPPDTRDAAAALYADRLRRGRALTIARTETLHASNFGQHLAWNELIAARDVDAASARRVWIAKPESGRTCPFCRALHGTVVGLNDLFVHPEKPARQALVPPIHPRCRCSVALRLDHAGAIHWSDPRERVGGWRVIAPTPASAGGA